MSRRVAVYMLVAMLLVAVFASVGGASDSTEASAAIDGQTSNAGSWASRLLVTGFVLAILMLILSPFVDIKRLIAIPITFVVVGAILKAGPQILAPFSALGATLR